MSRAFDREIQPDLYPGTDDAVRMAAALAAAGLPPGAGGAPAVALQFALSKWITAPGTRPYVSVKANNWNVAANVTPVPLASKGFPVDRVVLGVSSTALNSVYVGFGSGVTVTSGLELQPGIPVLLPPAGENSRELWELQRSLELITAILGMQAGFPAPGAYRAPRLVLDLNNFYVVAPALTPVYVMAFAVPEMQ